MRLTRFSSSSVLNGKNCETISYRICLISIAYFCSQQLEKLIVYSYSVKLHLRDGRTDGQQRPPRSPPSRRVEVAATRDKSPSVSQMEFDTQWTCPNCRLSKSSNFELSSILECNKMVDKTQPRIMFNPKIVVFYRTLYTVH